MNLPLEVVLDHENDYSFGKFDFSNAISDLSYFFLVHKIRENK